MTDVNTNTPPLHPAERKHLRTATTLVVTVEPSRDFHEDVQRSIDALERGESTDGTPKLSFTSYDHLMKTLTPRVLELIEAIRRDRPRSINQAARLVDRDVKNVHEELTRLARLGVIYFDEEGQSKRPVVWFDELVIDLPFDRDGATDAAPA